MLAVLELLNSVYLQIENELRDNALLDQGNYTATPPSSCKPCSECPVVPAYFYKLFQLRTANAKEYIIISMLIAFIRRKINIVS
jgi:hypothetical protein